MYFYAHDCNRKVAIKNKHVMEQTDSSFCLMQPKSDLENPNYFNFSPQSQMFCKQISGPLQSYKFWSYLAVFSHK